MVDYFDLIVIGTGPAGLTAAIYARRLGMRVAVGKFPGLPGWRRHRVLHGREGRRDPVGGRLQ